MSSRIANRLCSEGLCRVSGIQAFGIAAKNLRFQFQMYFTFELKVASDTQPYNPH